MNLAGGRHSGRGPAAPATEDLGIAGAPNGAVPMRVPRGSRAGFEGHVGTSASRRWREAEVKMDTRSAREVLGGTVTRYTGPGTRHLVSLGPDGPACLRRPDTLHVQWRYGVRIKTNAGKSRRRLAALRPLSREGAGQSTGRAR